MAPSTLRNRNHPLFPVIESFVILTSYFVLSKIRTYCATAEFFDSHIGWLRQMAISPLRRGHVSSESLFELLSYFRRFDSQFCDTMAE